MSFNPQPIMERIKSFLAASGRCSAGAGVGEPKAPPATGAGLYGAVMLGPGGITEVSLATASGRIALIVRLYRDAINEPLDQTEFLMGQTVFELIEDFMGDFDFGDSNVRSVLPLEVNWSPGYQDIGPTKYRLVDITVPLMVNDIATLTK